MPESLARRAKPKRHDRASTKRRAGWRQHGLPERRRSSDARRGGRPCKSPAVISKLMQAIAQETPWSPADTCSPPLPASLDWRQPERPPHRRRLSRQGKGMEMEIKRSGSQPSRKAPAEYFTGAVRVDPLFQAPDPARVSGSSVTFEPGARTVWHTHPLGQTLIVTAGFGLAQRWGGPVE